MASRLVWPFQGAAVILRGEVVLRYADHDILAVLFLGIDQRETVESLHLETRTRMLIALLLGMWAVESVTRVLF